MIISGATGVNSSDVNGIYFYQGMKDKQPVYTNLVNHRYLCYSSNGKWYATDKEEFDLNVTSLHMGWCRSVESGFGHPSRAHSWEVQVGGGEHRNQWVKQAAVKIATMVRPHKKRKPYSSLDRSDMFVNKRDCSLECG